MFAFAAAQVKKAMEVTQELGGLGYVFWGGREGHATLLNTDMKRELDHLARLLHMAVDYKKAIGFKGQFYIEPKPKEPTKHQYDSDAAAAKPFLTTTRRQQGLMQVFHDFCVHDKSICRSCHFPDLVHHWTETPRGKHGGAA